MTVHVAILFDHYIKLILSGEKRIESRLTRDGRTPFRNIASGDLIYFRASGGPYLARAAAEEVTFFDELNPKKIARLRARFNGEVCGNDEYWNWKKTSRYATFIRLRDVCPVSDGPMMSPSNGIAWFTLEDSLKHTTDFFEIELTAAAIRNKVISVPRATYEFPAEVCAASAKVSSEKKLTLHLAGAESVETDIVKGAMIRWRGWGSWLQSQQAKVGDRLKFTRKSDCVFDVSLIRGSAIRLSQFVGNNEVRNLVKAARREDLGPRGLDVTSLVSVPANLKATAKMDTRKHGRLAGLALLPWVVQAYDPAVELKLIAADGDAIEPGQCVAEFSGTLRSVLAIERVALNFVTHLSGIATLTSKFVETVKGTRARIYDTRKTIPGLRGLAKYAVVCGGGHSHRMGLYDAVLVKDNHIAHLGLDRLTQSLTEAVAQARALKPAVSFVEVEVDTLEQLERVLPASPDVILLDNMTTDQMRRAVALRDSIAPRVELEASGGVNLDTVRAIAQTGVERIAIGALTHSAPSLDLGLDITY